MKCRISARFLISAFCFFPEYFLFGQTATSPGLAWVDSIMTAIRNDQLLDEQTKSDLADSAFQVALSEKSICRQLNSRIIQATHLDNIGLTDSALIQLYWVNKHFTATCDSMLLMSLYRNMTNVFISLGELNRVDSISQLALALWNPKWDDHELRLAILNNWAIAYATDGDPEKAFAVFYQAYQDALANGNEKYIRIGLNNLGTFKAASGDLDSAYYYFAQAAIKAKMSHDTEDYMSIMINMANVNGEQGNYPRAIQLLDSVYVLADAIKNLDKIAAVQKARADLYALANDYKKAYTYLLEYESVREAYLNEERVKAVTDMQEKYESEKKARQIQKLEIENLDANLKNERIRHARNRLFYIGGGVLLLAIGLWTRLQLVHRSRRAIQKEKDISEGLLLNILPAEVADELKTKGAAEAKLYEQATILFSDFKSFTTIAGEMSAAELVSEINVCFKAFDEIMAKFGLEKIKTIGDAYMAAGSVPDNNKAEAFHVIQAALAMQDFIVARKKERDAQHQLAFEMRVGIHTGPVVAGIVGIKKFQYDLWGDTVNIANRMEMYSEPGRVNISATTYEFVKNEPSLSFTERELIHVKGKGEMAMYFVGRN